MPKKYGPGDGDDDQGDGQWQSDGTGEYTNGETTITYDTDGDQHVTVNEGW